MSAAKLTPWFSADVKPVHVGIYQILPFGHSEGHRWSYWNGKTWSFFTYSQEDLTPDYQQRAIHSPNKPWRGLVKQ